MKRIKSGGLHRSAAWVLSPTLCLGSLGAVVVLANPSAASAQQASSEVFYVDLALLGRDATDTVARPQRGGGAASMHRTCRRFA